MRSLEEGIGVIQRVPLAVLLDGFALEGLVGGAPAFVGIPAGGVLIDVVTEEDKGIDVALLDEFPIRGVIALLPVLA